jgi:hypothetical protein
MEADTDTLSARRQEVGKETETETQRDIRRVREPENHRDNFEEPEARGTETEKAKEIC